MNTSDKGTQTEAVLLSALVKVGYTVLVPFGPCRYDLALDKRDGAGITTVQCKTGRVRNGCIIWSASSVHVLTQERSDYRDQADYFGIWCPTLPEHSYLVPVSEVGLREGCLRVEPLRKFSNSSTRYRWAGDYEIKAPSANG